MTDPHASADEHPLMVDLLHDADVGYWCRIFDVSPAELRFAVQHAGPRASEVRRYLEQQHLGRGSGAPG